MAVPLYDHVVIVIEENHGFGDIIGSGSAPYINSLANGGALLTNYFADDHPSEPNYMIIYAGSDFGIGDDKFHAEPDPSLATKVQAAGKTFVGYVQSGSPEKHNPWEAFPEGTSVEQDFGSRFPTTTAGFAAMPSLSFVIPNLNNDMHDGTISQADTWLRDNIDAYAQWAKNNNSLLIITWDEDDSSGNNQVATIFYGANIVTGQYGATQYDHFNMCSTLAHLVGASPPRTTAAAIDGIYSATNIAPSVPAGLQASNVASTSLTLSWSASTGTAPITYSVLDRVGGTGSFVTVASGLSGTSRTVSGLTGSTTYNFEVVATGPGGTSAPSAILSVTTLSANVAPSVPAGLRAASVATSSVTLSWNASTGTAPITYSVLDRLSGTGSFATVASGLSGTSTSVTGLTPNTSYDFEVVAAGPGGTSAPSAVLPITTAALGGGSIIYILEESSSSSGPWTAVPGSPFATTTDTVAGLQASTSYFFRITAQDTLLGVTSPPTVVGPVLTTGSTLTESPQNTRISSPAASPVPPVGAITGTVTGGSLAVSWGIPTAIYDAALNEWTLFSSGTSSGVQIAQDGTLLQNTSNVLQLVYWNHTVYYEGSTQNQLGVSPGWWYLSPLSASGTTQTSPPPPPTTLSLDPLSASSSLTLSNLNMTAKSGSATPSGVRATAPVDTDKSTPVYFEVTVNAPSEHWACGMVSELFDFTSSTGLGTTENVAGPDSFGFFPFSDYEPARVYVTDFTKSSSYLVAAGGQNAVAGDVLRIAYNPLTAAFWVSSPSMVKDGDVWNNLPASSSDPTSGIGGMPFAAAGNDIYPAFWTSDSGSQATFNFGASTFAKGIPSGFVAYNQAARSNPTPPRSSIAAPTGLRGGGGLPTDTTIPLTWQAPAGGPYSYRVQRLLEPLQDNIPPGAASAWADVTTTNTTSCVATVPSFDSFQVSFIFRVQAIDSSGTHGIWSQPAKAWAAGSGSAATDVAVPWITQIGATNSSITIALSPASGGPVGATTSYSIWYVPLFGNTDIAPPASDPPLPSPWVLVNDNLVATNNPDPTATITGLSPGTQYFVSVTVDVSTLTQKTSTFGYVATTASSGSTLRSLDLDTWLIPNQAVLVNYDTDIHVFMPVGTTAHFAIYYDVNVYNNTTLANGVLSNVESVYSQCLTWFSAIASDNTASIETPINPDGSKINIFLVGPNYGGAHLTCVNADIFIGSSVDDRGYLDMAMMIVVAELTEVFMPQLQSLPDCDQHALGEGLSIALAFSLWPNGILVGDTTFNMAAYYLNTKTDAAGNQSNTGTARRDWVNSNPAGEDLPQFPAIGCSALFFGYLTSQLGFSFTQICTALNQLPVNATCRALYNKLANNTTDPFPPFIAKLNTHFPSTSQVDSVHFTQNPFPLA